MFESKLWEKLQELKNEKTVFIEGEAKKIGNVLIPANLFKTMEESSTIEIQTSLKERVKRIVKDYFTHGEDEQIKEIISKLKTQLSNKVVEKLRESMDKKDYEAVAEYLLVNYYDGRYNHANKDIKYEYKINNDIVEKAIKELRKIVRTNSNVSS